MAARKPMPKKYPILGLVKQLLQDAQEWSQAEIEMTRADAKAMMRNCIIALGFIFTSFAILIAAIFTLAQSIIGALATYLHGHIFAGVVVSFMLFALTMVMLAAARYFFGRKLPAKGLIFRRLTASKID
jgi:ABC-type multidrug transport system fused ATPase/permease subunit